MGIPTRGATHYSRQIETVLKRWSDAKGKLYTDYLPNTLTNLTAEQIAKLYDGRGGMAVDIRGSKRGLGIENRRKKGFFTQEAVALPAQLPHNLLGYFKGWLLSVDRVKKGVLRRWCRLGHKKVEPASATGYYGDLQLRSQRLNYTTVIGEVD